MSLTELYTADEVFTSGTLGELAPVLEIDGRTIGDGALGPVDARPAGPLRLARRALGHADPALTPP